MLPYLRQTRWGYKDDTGKVSSLRSMQSFLKAGYTHHKRLHNTAGVDKEPQS